MQMIQRVQSLRQARKQQGFTIIELVVVILLLGILAATALPRFMDVTDEAHDSVVSSLQGGLATGAALFRAQWYATGQRTGAAITDFGDGSLYANSSGYPIGNSTTFDNTSCLENYNGLLQSGRPVATSIQASTAGTPTDVDGLGTGQSASQITSTATAANIETAVNGTFDVVVLTGTGTVYCTNNGTTADCVAADAYFTTAAAAHAGPNGGTTLAVAQAAAAASGSCTIYYTGQYKTRQTGLDGTTSTAGQPVKGLETLVLSLSNGEVTRSLTAFQP